MRFLFLLYGDERAEAALSPAEMTAVVEQHMAFSQRLRDAGRLRGGEQLWPSSSASVLDATSEVVTDGPYADTKEQLGGLYVVECADLDDALALAKEIPSSPGLRIEIRPVESG